MSSHRALKSVLKRGAILAAANWQVTAIQAIADSLFKLLVAVPVIGGLFLVALAIGTEPGALISLEWRDTTATVITALRSHPFVLTTFVLAVTVTAVGGALFVFLVKAGTVAVLARSEFQAEAVEDVPLHMELLEAVSRFSIDFFIDSARALFSRYATLGFLLMGVYLTSVTGYLSLLMMSRAAGRGWGFTVLFTCAFVVWITLANLFYLLTQVVIAAEDCRVRSGLRHVLALLRHEWRGVALVFLVVLVLVVGATGASLIASAALGLIAFVPFVGLAMLPLQLVAWLLRSLVFQYIGLTSVGAYLKLYRAFADSTRGLRARAGGLAGPAMSHTG